MLFKTTRPDGRSFRDAAVAFLKDKPPETVLTFEAIAKALDIDPKPRTRVQAIVRSAIKPLLKLHQRGVKSAPGIGYRVLLASEHMLVSDAHRSKADRAISRGINFLEGVNRGEMTPMELKLHDGQLIIMTALRASHQHLDQRIDKLEKLLRGDKTVNA